MEEISNNFDKNTKVIQRAQKHKKLSSFEDEKQIIRDLRKIRPFVIVSECRSKSLKKVNKNPVKKLDKSAILNWILHHKMLLFYEL
jgi:hypothetical protein